MDFRQIKCLQSETEEFRSQRISFSEQEVQENTSKLTDFIDKVDLSNENINDITKQIVIFLEQGADINVILHHNIFQAIISNYQKIFDDYRYQKTQNDNEIDSLFELINKISFLSDEESQLIIQNSQIPQLMQQILKSIKKDHIVLSVFSSICNLIYKRPLTAKLFYDAKFIDAIYIIYNEFFFFNRFKDDINILSAIRSFELVFILLFTNPKDNKEIFDQNIGKIVVSVNSILNGDRSNKDESIYCYQLNFILLQFKYILENLDISIIDSFLRFNYFQSFLNSLKIDSEVTKNILNLFEKVSCIFSLSFMILSNDNFIDLRPDINDFECFQSYCKVWIENINTITDPQNFSIGKIQFILKKLRQKIKDLLQYFHMAGQSKENKEILSLTFIAFSYFDDRKIIELIVKEAPDIIERMSSQKVDVISKGFLNIIKHYQNSEIIQRIISQDLEKYFDIISEKLNSLNDEKVTKLLKEFKIVKIDNSQKEVEEKNNDHAIQIDTFTPDEKTVDSIQKKIEKYFDDQTNLYNTILSILEYQENMIFNIFEEQKFEDNKEEFERILKCIVSIADNHHRGTNFTKKINEIINYCSEQIKQSFSNSEIFEIFKSNKLILLYLIENKILTIDENIFEKIKQMNSYCNFFYPEIESFINSKQKLPDNFDENRHEGENESYICKLIRNDSVEDFITFITQKNLNLNSKINKSIFETNQFLIDKSPTLIEYSTFFGSIQIFRYLFINNVKLTPSLWMYVIHSQNPEMIHILEENHVDPEDKTYKNCLIESIKCHHNDIANYIKENLFIEKEKTIDNDCFFSENEYQQNLISYAFKFYNISLLQQYFDMNKFILFYLCQYNYTNVVKLLLKTKKLNINAKMILKKIIFILI